MTTSPRIAGWLPLLIVASSIWGSTFSYAETAPPANEKAVAAVKDNDSPKAQSWFDEKRFWFLNILLIVCAAIMISTWLAKSGLNLYVRPIAALEAIDEAVGRSTEMGRSMLFVPGIMDLNEIQTVAGLTILSRVAKSAAEYDTLLVVPTSRSLVMTAAREIVQSAYVAAGRHETFNAENIQYISDEQFAYVADVCGKMVRTKPAACFYLGQFFAESLIFAENGNSIGALQIAGTAESSQLPFFVAACDFTLLGEELFAASAYLSGEPQQLGSLKGQDIGKLFGAAILVLGCLFATWMELAPESTAAKSANFFVRETLLGKGGGE